MKKAENQFNQCSYRAYYIAQYEDKKNLINPENQFNQCSSLAYITLFDTKNVPSSSKNTTKVSKKSIEVA